MRTSSDYPNFLTCRISDEHLELLKEHMNGCGMSKAEVVRYLFDFYLHYNNNSKEDTTTI